MLEVLVALPSVRENVVTLAELDGPTGGLATSPDASRYLSSVGLNASVMNAVVLSFGFVATGGKWIDVTFDAPRS
jgi:hypothetical protein